MRRFAMIAAVVGTVLMSAAIARAGLLTGDPRSCSSHNATTCAHNAAVETARRTLAVREQVSTWLGVIDCRQTTRTSVFRWTCRSNDMAASLTERVVFVKKHGGWSRRVLFSQSGG